MFCSFFFYYVSQVFVNSSFCWKLCLCCFLYFDFAFLLSCWPLWHKRNFMGSSPCDRNTNDKNYFLIHSFFLIHLLKINIYRGWWIGYHSISTEFITKDCFWHNWIRSQHPFLPEQWKQYILIKRYLVQFILNYLTD